MNKNFQGICGLATCGRARDKPHYTAWGVPVCDIHCAKKKSYTKLCKCEELAKE